MDVMTLFYAVVGVCSTIIFVAMMLGGAGMGREHDERLKGLDK